jgi:hypothetical protein
LTAYLQNTGRGPHGPQLGWQVGMLPMVVLYSNSNSGLKYFSSLLLYFTHYHPVFNIKDKLFKRSFSRQNPISVTSQE